ncbi:CBS domain-containing protein [Parapedobacter sp. SGR-10]|uniref:CBS domain-containing protein n=1 Tax=Parapedobacter sp. SGR-10 TaxID=2710879 RepID=UPI0013D23175|nr:CBS domain-containing protein [Parapedobacter sp. SGR-10]NGF57455.1 CBS domain-containing protein [Parapedobacter sp. SGR-10]
MFVGQYISTDYQILPTDDIHYVLERMDEFHCNHLPVVNQKVYQGLISQEVLLEQDDPNLAIETISHKFNHVYLFDYQHIYDALQLMSSQDYGVLPVLDKQYEYLGVLTKQDILVALNELLGQEEGAIIVLELGIRDNALSHIARIIESENVGILNTSIHHMRDSDKLEMIIKVNKTNVAPVVSSLWRNDYVVKATFGDGSDQSDIQNRYELLMNYLDI